MKNEKRHIITFEDFREHTMITLHNIFAAVRANIMTKDRAWNIIEKFLDDSVKDLNKDKK